MSDTQNKHIVVINGPNMNLLGQRDNEMYGEQTLDDLETAIKKRAGELGVQVTFCQSNNEADLVNFLQKAKSTASGVILNPATLSKVGYPLLDALLDSKLPFVEVHISNVMAREQFRQESVFSQYAVGTICGLGISGYSYALDFLVADND